MFKCKIHKIEKKELPEIDDELIKDGTDFDTVEAFKEDAKKRIGEQREKAAQDAVDEQLVDGLIGCMTADIPEAMIENTINDRIQDFAYRLQSQGLSLEMYRQYTGMDDKAFRDSFREQAEKQVKVRLALEAVAKAEGIEVSDEDIEAEYARFAEQYKMPVEQIRAAIPEKALREDLSVSKAMDAIKAAAEITEE